MNESTSAMKTRTDLVFDYPITIFGARNPESGHLTFIGTNRVEIERIATEMCDGTRGVRPAGSVKVLQIDIKEVVTPPPAEKCPECGGRRGKTVADDEGYSKWIDCPACNGTGEKA